MQLDVVFADIWSDEFPANVEVLSTYRRERDIRYPGVPVRQFTDWVAHQEWMKKESAKYMRMVNNHRILIDCEEEDRKQKDS